MQRTSSLDIIEMKKHKKDNLMQSQLKKKKKKEPEWLLHLWLATSNNYMKELILVFDIMILEWITSNIDFNRSDFTTHTQ